MIKSGGESFSQVCPEQLWVPAKYNLLGDTTWIQYIREETGGMPVLYPRLTYAAIEKNTGVSHGTVVNCIKELEQALVITGVAADEVQHLHQLSIALAKKNLEPSKALLGIALFEKFKNGLISLRWSIGPN